MCVGVTGCTFVFASGPPAQVEHGARVECSETYAAPIADTVLAPAVAITGAVVIYEGTRGGCTGSNDPNGPAGCAFQDLGQGFAAVMGGLLTAAVTAVYAVSAYRGYRHIDPERCRQAKRDATR